MEERSLVIQKESLNDQVELLLREEIVTGRLVPGQRVDMDKLAQRWGISITPIRDALRRLEAVGFVAIVPRRGVYVSIPNLQSFKEIFDLRIALECLAIESAIKSMPVDEIARIMQETEEACKVLKATADHTALIRSDNLVHDLILKHCGNRKLVEIMEGLSDQIRLVHSVMMKEPLTYEAAVPEHLLILNALRIRDTEAAKAAMRTHLKNTLDRMSSMWKETDE